MIIELYEPAMCCSSGVCGPSVDPKLVQLQEDLRLIEEKGAGAVEVRRHNLSSDPAAFVSNAAVGKVLREQGPGVLPLVYVAGELISQGRYPARAEWLQALRDRGVGIDLDADLRTGSATQGDNACCPPPTESGCCGPDCC